MSTTTAATPPVGDVSDTTVHLLDLAAACVACTAAATQALHDIVQKKNTRTKADGSFVTDADFAAQGIIVQAIEQIHSAIDILGEESAEEMRQHMRTTTVTAEDDDDTTARATVRSLTRREMRLRYHKRAVDPMPLSPTYSREGEESNNNTTDVGDMDPNDPAPIDVRRIRVVVDPLDGTKSYATGEYEAVSILIAILVDAEPTFGVIGKPFGYGDFPTLHTTPCVTFYGGPLLGGMFVAGQTEPIVAQPISIPTASSTTTTTEAATSDAADNDAEEADSPPAAVISSSRSKGVVHEFCQHLAHDHQLIQPEPLLISGAGEKSLRCLLQRNQEALWFFPKGGTSLWDVAAPDALFRVLGGKLTDKFGEALDYTKSREEAENVRGVVACIDAELHTKCVALFQEGDWLDRI